MYTGLFLFKAQYTSKKNELNLKQAMSIMENHNIFLHLLNGCCHIVEIFYYALLCTTSIVCFCLLVAIWLVSFCFAGKVKSLLNNCRKTVVLTGNHLVLNDSRWLLLYTCTWLTKTNWFLELDEYIVEPLRALLRTREPKEWPILSPSVCQVSWPKTRGLRRKLQ